MKKLLLALVLGAGLIMGPVLYTGCTTTDQRRVYNSLATTGKTVATAYRAYLDQVFAGTVSTNDVPKITAQYRQFQAVFTAACVAANYATNLVETPPEVAAAAASVTSSISTTPAK